MNSAYEVFSLTLLSVWRHLATFHPVTDVIRMQGYFADNSYVRKRMFEPCFDSLPVTDVIGIMTVVFSV